MTDIIVKDIKNGSEYYYGGGAEVSAEDVSYDNTTSGMTADNVQDAIDEVFQSVSNGKGLIADAITDKGVSTSATDSFATMASNIESLTVGGKYTEGSSGDVLYVMDLDADGYSCYSTMQSEDGDNVYYYAGCLKRVGYNDYRYVVIKYNATENKMYTASFNSSTAPDTGTLNKFKFYKDGEKVWFGYRNDNWSDPSRYVIFGYFDSTNQFTQESTGADTSNNITQGCDTWSSGTTARKIENTLGSRKFIIMAVGGSGTPAVLIVV